MTVQKGKGLKHIYASSRQFDDFVKIETFSHELSYHTMYLLGGDVLPAPRLVSNVSHLLFMLTQRNGRDVVARKLSYYINNESECTWHGRGFLPLDAS